MSKQYEAPSIEQRMICTIEAVNAVAESAFNDGEFEW